MYQMKLIFLFLILSTALGLDRSSFFNLHNLKEPSFSNGRIHKQYFHQEDEKGGYIHLECLYYFFDWALRWRRTYRRWRTFVGGYIFNIFRPVQLLSLNFIAFFKVSYRRISNWQVCNRWKKMVTTVHFVNKVGNAKIKRGCPLLFWEK